MATPRGLEPPTSSVTGWHSTLLNYEAIYKIDFSLNLYVYIILKIYRKIKLFQEKIFVVSRVSLLSHITTKRSSAFLIALAARPRFELRLDFRLGGISNPLGYHYPTAP